MALMSMPTSLTSGPTKGGPIGLMSPTGTASLTGGTSTSSLMDSPNSGSLMNGLTPSLMAGSPTGGTVQQSAAPTPPTLTAQPIVSNNGGDMNGTMRRIPTAQPTTSSQGAASGMLGTGGTNTSMVGPDGSALSKPIASNNGGDMGGTMRRAPGAMPIASNNGGDMGGPMLSTTGAMPVGSSSPQYNGSQSVPTIGYPTGFNVGQGVNTSPSSLLPGGGLNAANLSTQQQVNAPTASSVVQQNPLTGPTNWNVTANQTLAGQYANLMSTGNPAIQAAEQQVIQANAAHGGNNDMMTNTAATMQGSQLALQIGATDAATQASAAQYNATAANSYASQLNQFTANAALSSQNFQQGVAMLNAQTNQQFQLMAGQINAAAYTTSMNLNASLASTQMQLNATTQTLDQQFTQNMATLQAQGTLASQQAYQQYGMNVRLGYLSSISQQQAALMQTIGMIQTNPNITSTQAQGAVGDAINEFNTFVTQMGAYASAMMPQGSGLPSPSTGSSSSASSTTQNNPTPSSTINASTWPSMSTALPQVTPTNPLSTTVGSGASIPSSVLASRNSGASVPSYA